MWISRAVWIFFFHLLNTDIYTDQVLKCWLALSSNIVCRLWSHEWLQYIKPFLKFLPQTAAVSPTVKGRTNLKIKEKYLSPAGSTSKGLTVSRSNSSLSLYSSASAPTSPMTRKARKRSALCLFECNFCTRGVLILRFHDHIRIEKFLF